MLWFTVSNRLGINDWRRFESSIPCGFNNSTESWLNFSLVDGEQIELLIISLNPIPTNWLLIIDSILKF